jgi:hypothetical protein
MSGDDWVAWPVVRRYAPAIIHGHGASFQSLHHSFASADFVARRSYQGVLLSLGH